MNICVYGAASNTVSKTAIKKTEELGLELAKRGHTLIFGGGANGMMGASARGVYKGSGKIIGVAPRFFDADGTFFEPCSDFIFCDTMRERKQLLESNSDAFIVAPGGIGTFDEFFEILTLRSLGRHTKAIAVYNICGYFDPLIELLDNMVSGGYMKKAVKELIGFYDNPTDILNFVENYKGEVMTAFDAKQIEKEK